MKSYPWPIASLTICYLLAATLGMTYAITSANLNLFSLGMIPVLVGIYLRADWGLLLLRLYIAIQALAIMALATTAVIAWQINPKEVVVQWNGIVIPIGLVIASAIISQVLQWQVAFSASTRNFFKPISVN
ncbi:hypothetical protein FJQ87_03990 [Shewanella sp. SNU WT4]|uniref:hypothetical protein n=1 Tax=Shewanella sp. SNU WT4 TaxID=2590015 RepID=UPI00112D76B9|nr:hypothetical protein [Shewanella sp. SNU WT4]QDF65946.1 hypothetical protein FJQ87_03990 [Shewanella sp. SNU WT4]